MSVQRPKCKNDLKTITQLITVPFADLGIYMNQAARERFEYHIERAHESFFINIHYYACFTDRIIFIAEFPAKYNFTLDQIRAKLCAWVSYCPWQSNRTLDDYIEKNAFKASFILGNMLQCFASAYNRMHNRKSKVSNLHESMIIEDNYYAWHNFLYEQLLPPFIDSLDVFGIEYDSIHKGLRLKVLYKSFLKLGMHPIYSKKTVDRLKVMVGFIFKFIREKLNKTTRVIRRSLNNFKDAVGSFIWGKMIACLRTIRNTVGQLKCYQLYKGIDLYTLRVIPGLKNL
jgi:hypothetical protein